jgi:hypothetical protein
MNAGFSSLGKLKAQLIAASMQGNNSYDDKVLAVGLGVAKQFECLSNRLFDWRENDTAIFSADRTHYYLPRFPFTTISRIEIRNATSNNQWQDLGAPSQVIINQLEETGYIFFGGMRGPSSSFLRVTYTGGFWWDTSEDDTGEQPDGSATLPEDFLLAWHLQCREIWRKIDVIGQTISDSPDSAPVENGMKILPIVRDLIDGMIRYQLT